MRFVLSASKDLLNFVLLQHHQESRKSKLNGRTADSSPSSATSASAALNGGRGLSPAAYLAALMQQRRANGEEVQNEKV